MKLLELFGFKTKPMETESSLPAIPEPEISTIVIDGKTIFTIFRDGNGYYSAQYHHKYSGEPSEYWLMEDFEDVSYKVVKYKTKNFEKIQDGCRYYINHHSLTKVGEIKFIPS